MRKCAALAVAWIGLVACEPRLVRVMADGVPTTSTAADPTFEIVARIAGARDPLPVSGSHVEYSDLETALGQAMLRTVPPRHDDILTVELIHAEADYRATRLSVELVARATLRSRLGNAFLAQTQVLCRDGAIVEPEAGARVIWSCMTRLGQDLAGWLADAAR